MGLGQEGLWYVGFLVGVERRGDFSDDMEGCDGGVGVEVEGEVDWVWRYAVFAKQGSVYGSPARSNVMTSSGTATLTWDKGRIPRLPRKVSAARLDP